MQQRPTESPSRNATSSPTATPQQPPANATGRRPPQSGPSRRSAGWWRPTAGEPVVIPGQISLDDLTPNSPPSPPTPWSRPPSRPTWWSCQPPPEPADNHPVPVVGQAHERPRTPIPLGVRGLSCLRLWTSSSGRSAAHGDSDHDGNQKSHDDRDCDAPRPHACAGPLLRGASQRLGHAAVFCVPTAAHAGGAV
jgi:hypothetical protein